MSRDRADRRAEPRRSLMEVPSWTVARLRSGHRLALVNVSAHGALIDTAARLAPGRPCAVEWTAANVTHTVLAHVTRVSVYAVRGESQLRYRAGLHFATAVPDGNL